MVVFIKLDQGWFLVGVEQGQWYQRLCRKDDDLIVITDPTDIADHGSTSRNPQDSEACAAAAVDSSVEGSNRLNSFWIIGELSLSFATLWATVVSTM